MSRASVWPLIAAGASPITPFRASYILEEAKLSFFTDTLNIHCSQHIRLGMGQVCDRMALYFYGLSCALYSTVRPSCDPHVRYSNARFIALLKGTLESWREEQWPGSHQA